MNERNPNYNSSRVIRQTRTNEGRFMDVPKKIHRITLESNRYKNQIEKIELERSNKIPAQEKVLINKKENNVNKEDMNDFFDEMKKHKDLRQRIHEFKNKIHLLRNEINIPFENNEKHSEHSDLVSKPKDRPLSREIKMTSSIQSDNSEHNLASLILKNGELENLLRQLENKYINISSNRNGNYDFSDKEIENLQGYYEDNLRKHSLVNKNSQNLKVRKNQSLPTSNNYHRKPLEVIETITKLKIETETTKNKKEGNFKEKYFELLNRQTDYKTNLNDLQIQYLNQKADLKDYQNQIQALERDNKKLRKEITSGKGDDSPKQDIIVIKALNPQPVQIVESDQNKRSHEETERKEYFIREEETRKEEVDYDEKNKNYIEHLENENENYLNELDVKEKIIGNLKEDLEKIISDFKNSQRELLARNNEICLLKEKLNSKEKIKYEKLAPERTPPIEPMDFQRSPERLELERKRFEIKLKNKTEKISFLEIELEKLKSQNVKNEKKLQKLMHDKMNLDQNSERIKEMYSSMQYRPERGDDDRYSVFNAKSQKDIYKILNDLGLKDNLVNILEVKLRNATEINNQYKKKMDGLNMEIDDLKSIEINYFNQIKDLETEIDLLNTDKEKFNYNYDNEMERIKKFYENEILKINENNESDLRAQNELNAELAEKNNDLKKEIDEAINTINILENQLATIEDSFNFKIKELLNDQQHNKQIFDNLLKNKTDLEKEIQGIKPFYENQLDEMADNFDQIIKTKEDRILVLEKQLRNSKSRNHEEVKSGLRNDSKFTKETINRYSEDTSNLERLLKESERNVELLKQNLSENDKQIFELQISIKNNNELVPHNNINADNLEYIDDLESACDEQKKLIENLLIKIFHLNLLINQKELIK